MSDKLFDVGGRVRAVREANPEVSETHRQTGKEYVILRVNANRRNATDPIYLVEDATGQRDFVYHSQLEPVA